jgi:multidrug resistance efflux pump
VATLRPIRTPWRQHFRGLRYQLAPVVVFAAAVVLTGWLWGRHIGLPNATGEVDAERYDLVGPVDGTLVPLPGKPLAVYDAVDAGQVVARLDDSAAMGALATLRGELERLRISLTSAEADKRERMASRQTGDLTALRQLAVDGERLRLQVLELQTLVEADKVEVARLTEMYEASRVLYEQGLESRLVLLDYEMGREAARKRIEGNQKAIEEAEAQKVACVARHKDYENRLKENQTPELADLAMVLDPIRTAVANQEARVLELQHVIQALEIRTPIQGTICAIYRLPGQAVRAGDPILAIAANQGRFIVSYIRETQRIRPVIGMSVSVQVRTIPRDAAWTLVERVGPQVEPVPPHHLRDPKVPEWGLPVRIPVPSGLTLKPGELVDIAFNRVPDDSVR